MHPKDFQGFIEQLATARHRFGESSTGAVLPFSLALQRVLEAFARATPFIQADSDAEWQASAIAVSVEGVLAAYVLLESGMPRPAHAALRNSLELQLIALSILHGRECLDAWASGGTLKTKTALEAIERNPAYSTSQRGYARWLKAEWHRVSRQSAHAYTTAFVVQSWAAGDLPPLLKPKGPVQYEHDFRALAALLDNSAEMLLAVPSLQDHIGDASASGVFAIPDIRGIPDATSSKVYLQYWLHKLGLPHEADGVPDGAVITRLEVSGYPGDSWDADVSRRPKITTVYLVPDEDDNG